MEKHILITGGTGLVGTHLTKLLLDKGYHVSHLSRSKKNVPGVKTFLWDNSKGTIDPNCINGVDIIIHLAGAGIADKRWTEKRKKIIIDSRTETIRLIYKLLKNRTHQVKRVISASATGFYSDRGNELMFENAPAAEDFLGKCCQLWENAVDEGQQLGLQTLKMRTGVVLTDKGGALQKLAAPIKYGIGAPLGSGKQWIPWIHLDDVTNIYLFGLKKELTGVYNMVAPNPVTNKMLTQITASVLKRQLWLPNIPAIVIRFIFGQMGAVVLGSTKVSDEKIEKAGYQFKYNTAQEAIAQIYGR